MFPITNDIEKHNTVELNHTNNFCWKAYILLASGSTRKLQSHLPRGSFGTHGMLIALAAFQPLLVAQWTDPPCWWPACLVPLHHNSAWPPLRLGARLQEGPAFA
eukprot:scaffold169420_cov39-Prasinocladus_malaysianus.AAC.1